MLLLMVAACKKDEKRKIDSNYQPNVVPANFTNSTMFTNPYLPFEAGKKYIYEAATADGTERVEVQRIDGSKIVMGITCIIVNDKVWLNNVLIEDTDDWFAQDNDGNVWYMGEDVDNFNDDGSFKDHHGAWEAGVDGALPGLIMPANPTKGFAYRQEYYFNEAEDQAEIVALNVTVETPYGIFTNCIQTHEWTELEPDANETKYYAAGIGVVKVRDETDNEEENLIDIQ
jgi:hypothetical protein